MSMSHTSDDDDGLDTNLQHNIVLLLFILDVQVVQDEMSWLANNHGCEELSANPCASTRGDGSFNQGNLDFRMLGELVCGAET